MVRSHRGGRRFGYCTIPATGWVSRFRRDRHERLTVRKVAALFGVCRATVYAMVERGQLPHLRLGAQIRFRTEVLRLLPLAVPNQRSIAARSKQAQTTPINPCGHRDIALSGASGIRDPFRTPNCGEAPLAAPPSHG